MAANYPEAEDEISYFPENEVVPEAGIDILKMRYKDCTKHPGHPEFYRASEISLDTLPEEIRTQENLDLIQKKMALTVRIRTTYTSKKRPDRLPNSCKKYPYADFRGDKKKIRYGTGAINRVLSPEPIKKQCPCHQCQSCIAPHVPNEEHYRFTVRTATHVIYNDSEAEVATFDLFFDSDNRKEQERVVKTLSGLCIDGTNTSYDAMRVSDVCDVICVTHDRETALRIMDLVVCSDSSSSSWNTQTPPGLPHTFSYTLPPQGVIVSHPHGCSKRISFGKIHHVTVPVRPLYETCKAMPVPVATKCRLNLLLPNRVVVHQQESQAVNGEKPCDMTSRSQDYVTMVEMILEAAKEDVTRPVTRLSNILNPETPYPKVDISQDDLIKIPTKLCEDISDENKKEKTGANKTSLRRGCDELIDAFVEHGPPTEFQHIHADTSHVLDSTKSSGEGRLSSVPDTTAWGTNLLLPLSSSVLHTSRSQHEEGVSFTLDQESLASRKEAFADFVTTNCRNLGIEDDMVRGLMGIFKDFIPGLCDETMTADRTQNVYQDLFTKTMNFSLDYSVKSGDFKTAFGNGVGSSTNLGGAGAGSGDGGNSDGDDGGCGNGGDGGAQSDSAAVVDVNGQSNSVAYSHVGDDEKPKVMQAKTGQETKCVEEVTGTNLAINRKSEKTCKMVNHDVDKKNENKDTYDTDENDDNEKHNKEHTQDNISTKNHTQPQRNIPDQSCQTLIQILDGCKPQSRQILEDTWATRETVQSVYRSLKPQAVQTSEEEFTLPTGLSFILPLHAPFAMRYYKESPGWFSFPSGTHLATPNGTTRIPVPDGTEFKSPAFIPKFSKVTHHDIPTCPGSSGATIYCNLIGHDIVTFFPHWGVVEDRGVKVNMSGEQENHMGMTSFAMEGFLQAQTKFVTRISEQILEQIGQASPIVPLEQNPSPPSQGPESAGPTSRVVNADGLTSGTQENTVTTGTGVNILNQFADTARQISQGDRSSNLEAGVMRSSGEQPQVNEILRQMGVALGSDSQGSGSPPISVMALDLLPGMTGENIPGGQHDAGPKRESRLQPADLDLD